MDDKCADLVFEGGGVKGIGLAGAFAALEQQGFTHKSVAGTSAGAITAALVAAGYSSAELDEIILKLPFASFKDEDVKDKLPGGKLLSILADLGIYEGVVFQEWIADLLAKKGKTKFGHIVNEDAENPDGRWCLRVIASDVTRREMLVLPNDAPKLGLDPDEMDIAYAVRMSMSIPIFFEPVKHENPKTGETHVIVDGGMLSNFPVWLFDCKDRDPRWPTFGLMLVEPEPTKPIGHRLAAEPDHGAERNSVVDFVKSLAGTMMAAHDRMYLDQATYARTVKIPTLGVGTTEFDIEPKRVQDLYDSGHQAATDFLAKWNFQAYIEEYRRGREHHRSDTLALA
jgi:NTE family protein